MPRKLARILAVVAAWLPLLSLWTFFGVVYGRESFGRALSRSSITTGVAALLGVAVWHFCARSAWPRRMHAAFIARHVAAALLYASLWVASMYAADQVLASSPVFRMTFSLQIAGWQLVMGVWLYGVIAGISYAIQTEQRALRAEALLAEARLEALSSRLHPHFLFNALHTVAALVRHDPAQAENAIEKLGEMLRYTLDDRPGESVVFADEWEFTRRYLEFEQLRYAARLQVKSDIDPRSLTCTAPSFALQTLVENAVRHSIAKRAEGGRIEISAHVDGERLHVRVADEGNGVVVSDEETGLRSGLRALRERLDAVYGGDARLDVVASQAGYEVTFAIPRERDDD